MPAGVRFVTRLMSGVVIPLLSYVGDSPRSTLFVSLTQHQVVVRAHAVRAGTPGERSSSRPRPSSSVAMIGSPASHTPLPFVSRINDTVTPESVGSRVRPARRPRRADPVRVRVQPHPSR